MGNSLASAPFSRFIDIGSAPGGWTFTLAARGARVVSIDPAVLAIPEMSNVLHLKMRAEDAVQKAIDFFAIPADRKPGELA